MIGVIIGVKRLTISPNSTLKNIVSLTKLLHIYLIKGPDNLGFSKHNQKLSTKVCISVSTKYSNKKMLGVKC